MDKMHFAMSKCQWSGGVWEQNKVHVHTVSQKNNVTNRKPSWLVSHVPRDISPQSSTVVARYTPSCALGDVCRTPNVNRFVDVFLFAHDGDLRLVKIDKLAAASGVLSSLLMRHDTAMSHNITSPSPFSMIACRRLLEGGHPEGRQLASHNTDVTTERCTRTDTRTCGVTFELQQSTHVTPLRCVACVLIQVKSSDACCRTLPFFRNDVHTQVS